MERERFQEAIIEGGSSSSSSSSSSFFVLLSSFLPRDSKNVVNQKLSNDPACGFQRIQMIRFLMSTDNHQAPKTGRFSDGIAAKFPFRGLSFFIFTCSFVLIEESVHPDSN